MCLSPRPYFLAARPPQWTSADCAGQLSWLQTEQEKCYKAGLASILVGETEVQGTDANPGFQRPYLGPFYLTPRSCRRKENGLFISPVPSRPHPNFSKTPLGLQRTLGPHSPGHNPATHCSLHPTPPRALRPPEHPSPGLRVLGWHRWPKPNQRALPRPREELRRWSSGCRGAPGAACLASGALCEDR